MPDTVVFSPAVNRPRLNEVVRKRLEEQGFRIKEADPILHGDRPRVTTSDGCVRAETFLQCMKLTA